MHLAPLLRIVPLALAALAAAGCCSFEKEWRDADACCGCGDDPLAGRWEGTWESHVNGHHGRLRAIITRAGPASGSGRSCGEGPGVADNAGVRDAESETGPAAPVPQVRTYRVRYHATFHYVLPFEYEVPMAVTIKDGCCSFSGQADLGCLAGGLFTYSGWSDGCRFESSYCSKKDHGVFSMQRVPCD